MKDERKPASDDGENRDVHIGDDQLNVLGRETTLRSVEEGYEAVLADKGGPPRWVFLLLSLLAILGFFGLRALTPDAEENGKTASNQAQPTLECRFERLVETSALVSVECHATSPIRMTVLARRWNEEDLEYRWLATTNRRIPIEPGARTELFLPAPDSSRAQLVMILATPESNDPLSDPEVDELLAKIRRLDPNSDAMFGLQTHALRVRRAVPESITTFPVLIPGH